MAKKDLSHHSLYLAIVAIVAFVAVVVLVLNLGRTTLSEQAVEIVDEEGNLVGQAHRFRPGVYQIQRSITTNQLSGAVKKGDLFLLAAPGGDDSVGEILEYKRADRSGKSNPKIKFQQWKTGYTLEYSIQNNQATIKLGGKSFKVQLQQPAQSDSPLAIDYDGDGVVDAPNVGKLNYKTKSVIGLGWWCESVLTLNIGESSQTLGGVHKVELSYIDNQKVRVYVDGIQSSFIELGRQQTVSNANVRLINLLYQAYAGGIQRATLCVKN